MLQRLFLEHPNSVGESYGRHARFAALTGARMIFGGLACVVHGLFPFLFVKTGSRFIRELHASLDNRANTPQCTTAIPASEAARASSPARVAP